MAAVTAETATVVEAVTAEVATAEAVTAVEAAIVAETATAASVTTLLGVLVLASDRRRVPGMRRIIRSGRQETISETDIIRKQEPRWIP